MSLRDIRNDWEQLARDDPYWAILSAQEKRGNRWDVEEFLATGRDDVDKWLTHLRAIGAAPAAGRALDFGCGVGRLSRALAPHFEEVVGVDVSNTMLERASALSPPRNVVFVHNDESHLRVFPDGQFDFVFSILVLQHLPPHLTLGYLREFARVLGPGGILLCEIPAEPTALPDEMFQAGIEVLDLPEQLVAGRPAKIRVAVENRSGLPWPSPSQDLVRIGNHWLRGDETLLWDDGRTPLPALAAGERIEVTLHVTPPTAGELTLELDVVAETVSWFADRGSSPVRRLVNVAPEAAAEPALAAEGPADEAGEPEPKLPGHWIDPRVVERELLSTGMEIVATVDRKVPGFDDRYYIARKPHGSSRQSWNRLRSRLRR